MNLYAGSMLIVDLAAKTVSTEPLRREWIRGYWGASGLALRYYCDLVSPEVDPMSPENAVVIMTGPFGGTLAPFASGLCLVSKSPQTGSILESNVGGAFGPELKFAGYDGIVIKGQSASPVFLKIFNDRVSLENAELLSGMGIFETEKHLEAAVGSTDAKSLSIGPAGENLVACSTIGSEAYRRFGRGGTGALFGVKKLKGIVCRGTGGVDAADMGRLLERIDHYKRNKTFIEANPSAQKDGTSRAIQAAKLGNRACAACPTACGKFIRINSAEVESCRNEALRLGGSNCDPIDPEDVIRFNRICGDLSLDALSCGSTIGLAMEMTESGKRDFNLRRGDAEEYLKVIYEIATLSTKRGCDLAMGAKKLAAACNAQEPIEEVRGDAAGCARPGNSGTGISYAADERNSCRLGVFNSVLENTLDVDALVDEVVIFQNSAGMKSLMCFCDFRGSVSTIVAADLLSAGLGEEVTAGELDRAGERIWNLKRLFNLRAGIASADDSLPESLMDRPLQDGPHAGKVFRQEDFMQAMPAYYRRRGWDELGAPSNRKLSELGLAGIFSL